jgi:hypothetical protein
VNAWKLALAAAIAAGLGAIAATIWVGAGVREETVVAKPYEAGLAHSECDLSRGPCTRPLAGGGALVLELSPRPLRPKHELAVRVEVRPPAGAPAAAEAEAVSASFSMPGMYMGENRVALAREAPGRWRGAAVLVPCPSGRREWAADVVAVRRGGGEDAARFLFRVEEGR